MTSLFRCGRALAPTRVSTVCVALLLVAACGPATSPTPSVSAPPAPTGTPIPSSTVAPSASLPAAPSPSPVAAHWQAAGGLATARVMPHVVTLGDGRVLVMGIERTGSALAAVETGDPVRATWTTVATLNKARAEYVAVPLADGRVLVTGGRNEFGTSFSSTFLFDPSSGSWTASGRLATARTGMFAATLTDGRVLVAGGYFHNGPTTGRGDPAVVLAAWPAAMPPGGGGGDRTLDDVTPDPVGAAMATAEVFDPEDGRWLATGPMKYARYQPAAVTLADGRVLVVSSVGGSLWGVSLPDAAYDTAELYDPAKVTFAAAGRLPAIDRAGLTAQGPAGANPIPEGEPVVFDVGTLVALDDGGAVLIGHAATWKHAGDITRSFRFDAASLRWTEIGQTYLLVAEPTASLLTTPGVANLFGAMAARLPDGSVLVAGGEGELEASGGGVATSITAAVRRYDPAADTWSTLPAMPEPRSQAGTLVLGDGSVLLVGGYGPQSGDTAATASAVLFVPEH